MSSMAIKCAATIQYLTQEELRRLLAAVVNRRDLAIIYTAYRYGLRASEVGLLLRQEVDLTRQRIRIHR